MSRAVTRSFAKTLFLGEIREEMVFPYPRLDRSARKRVDEILSGLHALARACIDPKRIDEEAVVPAEVLDGMKRLGLFGMSIPEALGGLGLPRAACCRVFQELGGIDLSLAMILSGHLSLGCQAILDFGTEEQKARYLPALARGERLAAFCQNEPQSGSDAASIRTRATLRDHEFVINGTKVWILNGGVAEVLIVLAQTEVIREGARVDRITCFITERGPGIRSGAEERKLGVRGASTTAVYFEDVRVPRDSILGAVGGGFKVSMEVLNSARLALSASCIGVARELFRQALKHATSRRQFGRLLVSFGMIKDKLARMQVDLYGAESMLYLTAGIIDGEVMRRRVLGQAPPSELDCSLESACCKVFASEMLWRLANETQQIAGGAGYMHDYPYERLLRDSRLPMVYQGTNEILRCYIALVGMQEPGEQLSKLADAIRFPVRGYGLVMDTILERVRAAAYGGAVLTQHHGRLKKEAVMVEDGVEALQKGIERALRRHGRQISEMQYVQRRVADVVIDLYGMIACVSRASAALIAHDARRAAGSGVEAAGEIDGAERELRLCRGFCGKAGARIRRTLDEFNENDDELMKRIADDSYHGPPYPFDGAIE